MAQGTPVIATSFGAVGELVRSSGGGIAYSGEDELFAAIESVGSRPALRDELARRAKETFVARWSEKPHLDAYFELIDEAAVSRDARVRREPPRQSSTRTPEAAD